MVVIKRSTNTEYSQIHNASWSWRAVKTGEVVFSNVLKALVTFLYLCFMPEVWPEAGKRKKTKKTWQELQVLHNVKGIEGSSCQILFDLFACSHKCIN